AVEANHAVDEVGAQAPVELRTRLDLAGFDFEYFIDTVDQDAERMVAVINGNFYDDHAGAPADGGLSATETHRQIDDRYYGTTQIDDPAQEVRHHRNLGQARVLDDFANRSDVHRKGVLAQREGQVLHCFVRKGIHGLSPQN